MDMPVSWRRRKAVARGIAASYRSRFWTSRLFSMAPGYHSQTGCQCLLTMGAKGCMICVLRWTQGHGHEEQAA